MRTLNERPLSIIAILAALLLILVLTTPLRASEQIPPELQNVGIDPPLGKTIQLQNTFTDESAQPVALSRYFHHDQPVVLILAYYECPMLCTLVLNNFTDTLKKMDWTPGKEFQVLVVSIDPTETPQLAADKKKSYLESYGRPRAAAGWHFLVGQDANIKSLAGQIGFKYHYDKQAKQYAHATGLFILTPDGKLSQCFYGIEFSPTNLRLALLEAGEGKIGSAFDKLLLFCYHYDPLSRSYTLAATRIIQLGGILTVMILGLMISLLIWRERHQAKIISIMGEESPESEVRSPESKESDE